MHTGAACRQDRVLLRQADATDEITKPRVRAQKVKSRFYLEERQVGRPFDIRPLQVRQRCFLIAKIHVHPCNDERRDVLAFGEFL